MRRVGAGAEPGQRDQGASERGWRAGWWWWWWWCGAAELGCVSGSSRTFCDEHHLSFSLPPSLLRPSPVFSPVRFGLNPISTPTDVESTSTSSSTSSDHGNTLRDAQRGRHTRLFHHPIIIPLLIFLKTCSLRCCSGAGRDLSTHTRGGVRQHFRPFGSLPLSSDLLVTGGKEEAREREKKESRTHLRRD